VFALAQRVAKPDAEKPIYGFSFTYTRWMDMLGDITVYTNPLELRYFDEAGEKMTVNTPEWEKVWTKLYQLQKDKVIPPARDKNRIKPEERWPFWQDRFMSGELAMTIKSYGELERMIDANQNASNIKNYTPIDFDVITIPNHPENPGVVPNVHLSGLMGISSKATNVEDAWELLKFINSPEWAKVKKGGTYELSARKSYIKPKDGVDFNIEAFYNIKPSSFTENDYNNLYREKPHLERALDPGRTEIDQILSGEKTVQEGLKSWQEQGDSILQESKANPK
jgi:multiple sugar transport system substrate-binding protein